MPLVSRLGAASSRGFGQFTQQVSGKYIEDYFSTYLYTGDGASRNINNDIALSNTSSWSTYRLPTGTSNNLFKSVATDSSGNFYAAGTATTSSGTLYIIVAKYGSSGSLEWQRSILDTSSRLGLVAVDSSGNVYVVGETISPTIYCSIVKYNSSGVLQWQRKLSSSTSLFTRGVYVDSSSNLYIAAYDTTYSYAIKYNSSGALQWQRRFRVSTTPAYSYGISTDSSGNVYLAGENNSDFTLNKYDASGAIQWQRNSLFIDTAKAVAVDSSNNIYVLGEQGAYLALVKYNTSGVIQWSSRLTSGTSTGLAANSIATDSSGNIYIAGNMQLNSINSCIVAKYNSSGTIQWQRKLADVYAAGNGISVNSSGDLFVAIQSNYGPGSLLSTSYYGAVVKLSSDGSTTSGEAFVTMYDGNATSSAGSYTDSANTGTDGAGTLTDAAGIAVDSAASLTAASATQSAISNSGGLVWIKARSAATDHALYDTVRGATFDLVSNSTAAQTTQTTGLTGFSASGFSIGALAKINTSAATYASWTFRKAPKFFDVVTFTYAPTGAPGKSITHNLGSTPGMIIVKSTTLGTGGGASWYVSHRATPNPYVDDLYLNSTAAAASNNGSINGVTSTAFNFIGGGTVGVTQTYVAYIFAHNAGGFGADGSQNVISCGSYTGNGSATGPTITLGYEPQFVLVKSSSNSLNWHIVDIMRGMTVDQGCTFLYPNLTNADGVAPGVSIAPTPTGFQVNTASTSVNTSGATYIYMAIRRGPMRVPTDATKVFKPSALSGTFAADTNYVTTNFPVDFTIDQYRLSGSPQNYASTRLTNATLGTQLTSAEDAGYGYRFYSNTGVQRTSSYDTSNIVNWSFARAPGFFDVTCYTGTGSSRTVSHNLGVTPELMIVKSRNRTGAYVTGWFVFAAPLGATGGLTLNSQNQFVTTSTWWNNTSPTNSVFTVGTNDGVNASVNGNQYVAYLFASCPGVSKVGSYTGTGTTKQVDCGFTAGARFVLIKRTDSTGDWYVYDSARGIIAGNDPYLFLNSAAAEVTSTDYVDTYAAGFELSSTAPAGLNANGGTYIFLAIA